jgi:hypothetical protein
MGTNKRKAATPAAAPPTKKAKGSKAARIRKGGVPCQRCAAHVWQLAQDSVAPGYVAKQDRRLGCACPGPASSKRAKCAYCSGKSVGKSCDKVCSPAGLSLGSRLILA